MMGTHRCALLMRYTPAASYYYWQKGIEPPLPPDAPQVERIFIVSESAAGLDERWREELAAAGSFERPRFIRRLLRSDLYAADRLGPTPLAATATPEAAGR